MQSFEQYTFSPSRRVHDLFDCRQRARAAKPPETTTTKHLSGLASRIKSVRPRDASRITPQMRMNHCRQALERLDVAGWKRSYHQRLFHDDFLKGILFYQQKRIVNFHMFCSHVFQIFSLLLFNYTFECRFLIILICS